MIEKIAAFISFFFPIYLAANVYTLVKLKNATIWSISKISAIALLIIWAYWYLQPNQRIIAVSLMVACSFVVIVVVLLAKLFRKR